MLILDAVLGILLLVCALLTTVRLAKWMLKFLYRIAPAVMVATLVIAGLLLFDHLEQGGASEGSAPTAQDQR